MSDTPRDTPRDVVLAALDGGLSIRKAAVKFGLPQGTVARWVNDRKHGREPKTVATLHVLPTVAPPAPKIRAREATVRAINNALGPAIKADLRDGVSSLTTYIAQTAKLAAAGRPEDAGEDWRPPDMHQLAAACRGLDALLARSAELLAFDTVVDGPTETTAPDMSTPEARAAIRARLLKLPRSMREGLG